MNILDIILLVPLAYAAFKGFTKGFVFEIFSLLALGLGVYGCIEFSDYAGTYLAEHVDSEKEWFPILTYTVTFVIIVVAVSMLGKVIDKMISFIQLGLVNKLLGVLFGLIKSAFFLSALLMIFNALNTSFNFIDNQLVEDSILYEPISKFILLVLPGDESTGIYKQFYDGLNGLFL